MKIKCKICGCEFNPIIEKHYISRDAGKSGLVTAFSNDEEKLFDTFDCPECGCQVIAQERKRVLLEIPCDEDEEDESEKEHDGCDGCMYQSINEDGYPCKVCKSSYMDKYERKE